MSARGLRSASRFKRRTTFFFFFADFTASSLERNSSGHRTIGFKPRTLSQKVGILFWTAAMVASEDGAGRNLSAAAAKGDVNALRRLLDERGLHPDTVNEFGHTALQVMMMGSTGVAVLLLQHGANANVQDGQGVTPAHDAARTGFVHTLRALVDFGASVNVPDCCGALPIHIALQEAHTDVVEFLAPLSNLRHRDACGRSALDVARESNSSHMVSLLERHLESSKSPQQTQ
ncbi:cyclin-dependent kinase 4 inhibitor D-like [Arapaima gigas]